MMPIDYQALHKSRDLVSEHQRLLRMTAGMYAEPSHFIIELLQNAEDALGKRPAGWDGSRTVSFAVGEDCVEIAHYGRPFNEEDVRGIVITRSSTKADDLNDIGQFGVGFKSVFNITDRPEIRSGDANFAIEELLIPVGLNAIPCTDPEMTLFRLPLNDNGIAGREDIIDRLADLDARTLLFLRHTGGITWCADQGRKGGLYRQIENLGHNVRKAVITRENAAGYVASSERWVVFSRPVADDGKPAGSVEIAFRFSDGDDGGLQPPGRSMLTVFFPTTVETHLGFLMHGPYRTTPNRETVPVADEWNRALVRETAALLPEALQWLKDSRLLDAGTLDGFPIREYFQKHERLEPLYDATKAALMTRALLPCANGSYHPAGKTRLGSTEALRRLFPPRQLAELYGESGHLFWVAGNITADRFEDLRRYIRDDLGVTDLTPDSLLPLLRNGRAFLESQTDKWVRGLYEFFAQQSALYGRMQDVPLLRLADGRHIAPSGVIQAFLPGKISSSAASTIHKDVCNTDASLRFLKGLGLRKRDPVDDVIENILPAYSAGLPNDSDYDADVRHIVYAYKEVSTARKDAFIEALSEVPFVKTVDAADGSERFATPEEVYLANGEQKALFANVPGLLFLDGRYDSLSHADALAMLEDCGATSSDDMSSIIIKYVLPKYRALEIKVDAVSYAQDIKRIVTAYEATPNNQSLGLRNRLQGASFVRAIDTGNGKKSWRRPASVYLATEQLHDLFDGVEGVWMVDCNQTCLRGEKVRNLLKSLGASDALRRISHDAKFTWQEKREMRKMAGCVDVSGSEKVNDYTLIGLDALLATLPELTKVERLSKAKLLWESLCELADASSTNFFGAYEWSYYSRKSTTFEAAFVRELNDTAWIPDAEGVLRRPASVLFDTLGWRPNEFLETKIRFQPPAVQELARKTGIELGALDLFQREKLTEAGLRELIDIKKQREQAYEPTRNDDDGQPAGRSRQPQGDGNANGSRTPSVGTTTGISENTGASSKYNQAGTGATNYTAGDGGTRNFVSYIAAHPTDTEDVGQEDSEHTARMSLEENAIAFIIKQEPQWLRTAPGNAGYDLYQVDRNGSATAWCEVKAMRGTFGDRSATMSRRQFEEAQHRGAFYWLYVVENAGTDSPSLVKIQNPAGQAGTFTFDKGWLAVAEIIK